MFKVLKKTNRTERLLVVLSFLFVLIQVGLELKVPNYMSKITERLQEPGTTTSDILSLGLKMVALSLSGFVLAIIVGFFAARISASLSKRIRGELFDQVVDYSTNEIQHFSVPSLITRTTNDLTQIQLVIATGLQLLIKCPITIIWAFTIIANKNWKWTAMTGVAIFILLMIVTIVMTFVRPKFIQIQGLTDDLNGVTKESLTGIRVVRAYNAENYQDKKFKKVNDKLTNANLFTGRIMAIFNPTMTLISSGLTLTVYWIGTFLIQAVTGMDKINLFSDMVVFTSYSMQIVMSFMMLISVFFLLPRAAVAAKRINEVLALSSSVHFSKKSIQKEETTNNGSLSFENVSFTYPNTMDAVLHNVSFSAKKGQTVAIIGSTGSGKSTILKLMVRLFDRSSGEICLNGREIKDFSHEELNNIIGYIPQKPILYTGTIRSNMELGKSLATPLDDQKILKAIEIAQAKEFVDEQADKLDAHVSQGGNNFSGGQKQRLAIARVIARQPEILLFDDSFSALDYKTDNKLRATLKEQLPNTTKIIVAQRINTIIDANLIVVLENGKVVGKGTHKQLLAENKAYQEIAYSQLSKEELANE